MIDWAVVFRRQSPRYGRVVDGTCGLFEYMKKGRLKTGSPFSDDVFICFFKDRVGGVFRGQSPRYGWVVDGVCGLIEHMKKGRLKTGSPFSDDVFYLFF